MTDFSGSAIQGSMTGHHPGDGHDHSGEYLVGGNPDWNQWDDDYKWNLDPVFRARLENFIAANPYGVELLSGWRNNDHQQRLVDRAQEKYGDDWRKWAAPPGGSNHNHGVAGDLHYLTEEAKQWAHDNAHRFGLEFPMGHEPWHVEPLGLRTGGFVVVEDRDLHDAYTIGPYGTPNPADVTNMGFEGSAAMLNTLMTGALPPASALDEAPEVVAGPTSLATHDQALSGPGEASGTEPTVTEETHGDQS